MIDQFSRGFGFVAAFVLPGLLGLYALSFHSVMVRDWFGTAAAQPTTVGGFLFASAASLGIGLFLSGVRWMAVDRLLPPAPAFDTRLRTQAECERVYQDIRLQHYVFYQFYANTLCALVLLYLAWLVDYRAIDKTAAVYAALLIVASVVLWLSAKNALSNHDRKMLSLAGGATVSAAVAAVAAAEAAAGPAAAEAGHPASLLDGPR